MKRHLLILLLLPFYAQAQSVQVGAGVPPNVTASASYRGAQGTTPIYYWVCTRYPSGYTCMVQPVSAVNTPGIAGLGGGNSVTINWSPGVPGATGYDVIRQSTGGSFNGTCTNGCAIALNINTVSYVDSSPSAGSNYPPGGLAPVQAAAGQIRLNNANYPTPGLLWDLNGIRYPFGLVPVNAVPGDCVTFSATPPFLADIACSGSGGINQLTGDVTAGPGTGSQVATLATVNSGPGSCGDATHVCQVVTNGKGLVTAQSQVVISASTNFGNITSGTNSSATMTLAAGSSIVLSGGTNSANELNAVPFCTGFSPTEGQAVEWTALSAPNPCYKAATPAGGGINQLTGDGTAGPGTGSQALTFATVNSGPGSCGDATDVCQVTTNGKGLVTSQTPVAITFPSGIGFHNSPTTTAIVTDYDGSHVQTPNALTTLDSSGDLALQGNAAVVGSLGVGAGSGSATSLLLYSADGNDVNWNGPATGVNAAESWIAWNPTANGQVPTSSGCSGNNCNVTWSAPAAAGITQLTGSVLAGPGSGSQAATIASSVNLPGSPTTTTQAASDNSTKVATTAYVTTGIANAIAGVNPAVAVQAATTAALPAVTYSNGTAGIGATLTENSAAALVVDGYTALLGDRLLIKNQASAFQNGVYLMTTLGTGIIPFVLTRALDYDQPSDINSTGAIPVVTGTVNALTSWLLTSTVNTVGTDSLVYAQFTVSPSATNWNGNGMWQISVPTTGAFTAFNTTNQTVKSGTHFVSVNSEAAVAGGAHYISGLHQACPAAPWTIWMLASIVQPSTATNALIGIEVDDGTKYVAMGAANPFGTSQAVTSQTFSNSTTFNSTIGSVTYAFGPTPVWYFVSDTAGTLTVGYSIDGTTAYSLGTSTYLSAATNCGFFADNANAGNGAVIDVFAWNVFNTAGATLTPQ
jgi:hypothetical protein